MRIAVAGGTGVVGRHVVAAAREAGHDVVVLSRSKGVDVRSGGGLAEALDGVDVVVDALNVASVRRRVAERFFVETSTRLQEVGHERGVAHLVTLSIVGIDRDTGYGYYDAKLAQERAAQAGPVPCSVLRATQFHEFPGQMVASLRLGPVAAAPRMQSRTVAARTVGEHLVRLAADRPGGVHELGGPEVHDVVDLARRTVGARGERVRVVPLTMPGRAGRAFRSGLLLPGADATLDGPTFEQWLASPDAAAVPLHR